ncbi:hypothetical protein SEA_CHRIDISON_54 [Arthrobacter phage Chridison]|uniref:Uncharacterized protein n=6 Tax=Korravirus hunterdalle TaxID=1982080 RepID=A0A3G8FV62_9CAUD|nr:hypothetical protein FDH58_gp57 [Arthrobacter phage HunterDalle]ALY10721.1 hypothetical protein VULTURE_57 [Arthrobacter phage Vulture]AZF98681.1 hypothetical protein SEA_ALEDEL_57 [Arthrobacter phage Aledel]AZS07743.1 hypothetical protein SEA_EUNOIA_59 [Arthrobacter phage Eunoia]AZS09204.1 hypothetical protein SEA_OMALLEY_57 [Arthrobacter phage OMalley]AZS09692.1 hypothetical protein SEA_RIOVINA_57 [Arthrobacter phage Riovina]AZS10434.1 hypothetical protein SEA_SUPAKEV_57 [Arthrobacter ph
MRGIHVTRKVQWWIKCEECGTCSLQDRPLTEGEFWLCKIHEARLERKL